MLLEISEFGWLASSTMFFASGLGHMGHPWLTEATVPVAFEALGPRVPRVACPVAESYSLWRLILCDPSLPALQNHLKHGLNMAKHMTLQSKTLKKALVVQWFCRVRSLIEE